MPVLPKRVARVTLVVAAALGLLFVAGRLWIARREPLARAALPAEAPGRQILVNGRLVRVLERGSGPALVLIHGTGGSVASWPPDVIDALAQRRHVVALDLFGMGFSERSDAFHYGWDLWADEVAGTLDALGIERASLVGHSLGGTVALVFADRYPERIDRLVLVGSASSLPGYFFLMLTPGLGELYLAAQHPWGEVFSEEQLAQARAAYRIAGTRGALLRYARSMPWDGFGFYDSVARVRAPTLQIHGSEDREVPLSAAKRFSGRLRDTRLVVVEGAGHYLMIDAPKRLVELLLEFTDPGP